MIDCSEILAPKALAVAVWVHGAGCFGITVPDIAEATGLSIQVCDNTIGDMLDAELATVQSGSGRKLRRYVSSLVASPLPDLVSVPSGGANGSSRPLSFSFACFSFSSLLSSSSSSFLSDQREGKKNLLRFFLPVTNREKFKVPICENKSNDITDSGAESVTKLPATLCTTNLADRSEEERTLKSKKKIKLKVKRIKPQEDQGEPTHSSPEKSAKRKLREASPRKGFRAELEAETPKPNGGSVVTSQNRKKNPSTHPDLRNWERRGNPNKWRKLDWVGYWLDRFRNRYDIEDPHFVGLTVYRSMSRAKERNDGKLDAFWYTGIQITKMGDSDRGFGGDWAELKNYIDWVLDEYVVEADWLSGPIMARQVFRITDNFFLEKYRTRDIKPKGLKKKTKGKWHHWGFDPNG